MDARGSGPRPHRGAGRAGLRRVERSRELPAYRRRRPCESGARRRTGAQWARLLARGAGGAPCPLRGGDHRLAAAVGLRVHDPRDLPAAATRHAARFVPAILLLLASSAWASHHTTGSVPVHGYTTRSDNVAPYTRSAPHSSHPSAPPSEGRSTSATTSLHTSTRTALGVTRDSHGR